METKEILNKIVSKAKNYALLLFVIIIAFGYFSLKHKNNVIEKERAEKTVLINNNSSLKGELLIYKDKAGQLQTQVNAFHGTVSTLKNEIELLGIDKKSLRKQVGNLNNMLFIAETKLQATGSGKTKIEYIDTTKQNYAFKTPYFNFSDSLLNIHGDIYTDTVGINYKTKPIKITLVSYEKNPLFGNPVSVMDIKTTPYIPVVNANAYTVKHKEPFYEVWWIDLLIGLGAGYLLFK